MLSTIPGLSSQDASRTLPLLVTTKNVSRYCKMSPEGQNLWLRPTGLNRIELIQISKKVSGSRPKLLDFGLFFFQDKILLRSWFILCFKIHNPHLAHHCFSVVGLPHHNPLRLLNKRVNFSTFPFLVPLLLNSQSSRIDKLKTSYSFESSQSTGSPTVMADRSGPFGVFVPFPTYLEGEGSSYLQLGVELRTVVRPPLASL